MATITFDYLSSGTGSFTSSASAKGMLVKFTGAGGGGGCAINNSNGDGTGSDGGDTTFNGITAKGGKGGNSQVLGASNLGGLGGEGGSGTATLRIRGNDGETGYTNAGRGASNPFFGGGSVMRSGEKGAGGSGNTYSNAGGSGGGSGECVEYYIDAPGETSFSYSVGDGGAGGQQISTAPAGFAGGDGIIEIIQYF